MSEPHDTKEQILSAAMDRILHYGYSKTTMAEIARDCEMSAGNIYRFYDSKLDIAEALAHRKTAETFRVFSAIAARKNEPAAARLEEFFQYRLKRSFDMVVENPKLLDLVDVLSRERPEFGVDLLARECVFIVEVLEQGVAAGEFRALQDTQRAAKILQTALIKFEYPPFWSAFTYEELNEELSDIMRLIKYALESYDDCDLKKGGKPPL